MTASDVKVVCTNKGLHDETVITPRIGPDGWQVTPTFAPADSAVLEEDRVPLRTDGQPNDVFVFMCRRCGRTPELQPETFRKLFSGLFEHGVSKFDISDLPF